MAQRLLGKASILTSCLAALAAGCIEDDILEVGSDDFAATASTARVQGKLVRVKNELGDIDQWISETNWDDGNTDCDQPRLGWTRASILDARICYSNPQRIINRQDCSVRPTKTDPMAYFWLMKCGTSDVMVDLYRSIKCNTVATASKRKYTSFYHHVASRKCGLDLDKHCTFNGVRYGHNDLFVAHDAATATFYSTNNERSPFWPSRTCSEILRTYQCNDGTIEGVGHTRQPGSHTCEQVCKENGDSDDSSLFWKTDCESVFGGSDQGQASAEEDGHLDELRSAAASGYTVSGPRDLVISVDRGLHSHDDGSHPHEGFDGAGADENGLSHEHEGDTTVYHAGDSTVYIDSSDEHAEEMYDSLLETYDPSTCHCW